MTATRKPWTPEQIKALRRLYPHYSADVVGRVIGRDMSSVHAKANALGIAKSEAFQASAHTQGAHNPFPASVRHRLQG
jgi:hypothetical protein